MPEFYEQLSIEFVMAYHQVLESDTVVSHLAYEGGSSTIPTSEVYINPMDCVNPTAVFDNPFPLISPARSLLSSSHSSPGDLSQWFLPSPPLSSFEVSPVLDFRNINEDKSGDSSPIGQANVNETTPSGCLSLIENTLDQCSPAAITKLQSFSSQRSASIPRSPLPAPRRRPGRPSKSQLAIKSSAGKRPSGRSLFKTQREMHNDTSSRSRERLNAMLDDLWSAIPTEERVRPKSQSNLDSDLVGIHSRADKVEVAISYMRRVQEHLKSSSDGVTFV